jgi:hypothetical protein
MVMAAVMILPQTVQELVVVIHLQIVPVTVSLAG